MLDVLQRVGVSTIRSASHCTLVWLMAVFLVASGAYKPVKADSVPVDGFNKYILRAVDELLSTHGGRGYDIKSVFTHKLPYNGEEINPTNAPLTMCVAAVAEVIITALNIYSNEQNDRSIYSFLPRNGWVRMRPTDIKSHIWVDPNLDAYGTADALVTFGIGKHVRFSELTPGSFVNLNRNIPGRKPSGHAVVFLAFIDDKGTEVPTHSPNVAGFKYFSAQGQGLAPPDSGFGIRYAFFMKDGGKVYCPRLGDGKRADCGVTYSRSQKLLNTGYMLHPKHWNATERDENLEEIRNMFRIKANSRGPEFFGIPFNATPEQIDEILNRDIMKLNPLYEDITGTDN